MNFVENPLKREPRRVKTTEAEEEEEEVNEKIDFTRHQGPIYNFDEIRRLLQEIEPSLKGFFDQLYLAAQLFERNGPYEEINGGIHVLSSCFK